MLVLTRKLDESIVIDGGIKITVVEIEGGEFGWGSRPPRKSRSSVRNSLKRRRQRHDRASRLGRLCGIPPDVQ